MSCDNAAKVQLVLREGFCLPVEGCEDGPPVEVTGLVSVTVDQATNFHSSSAVFTASGQFFDVDVRGMSKGRLQLNSNGAWLIGNSIRCLASVDGVNFIHYWMEIDNSAITAQQGKYIRTQFFVGPNVTVTFHVDVGSFSVIRIDAELVTAGQTTATFAVTPFDTFEPTYSSPLIAATAQALPLTVPYGIDFNGNYSPASIFNFIGFVPSTTARQLNTSAAQTLYSPITGRFDYTRNTDTFNTVQANAAGNTALWTPGGGRRFRLMRYKITITGDAAMAAAAVLTVSLFDAAAGATGQAEDFYVPLAAGLVPGMFTTGWIDLGNGYLSAVGGNVLNVNLSAALTVGNVRVVCCGTEE